MLRVHAFLLAFVGLTTAFSKYGRSCKDIGCLSNEVCVMETDPCSYYQRQNECGSYPTCKRVNSGPPSCKSYVCPPTKVCRMDNNTPKCVDDHSKVGRVGYDTAEVQSADQPSNTGNLYPNLPRGQTTERPNIGYQGGAGTGYQGGQVGSGYPGQSNGNYPQQGYGGYPQQQPGGYPQYPQRGYPQQQPGGYPQQYPPQGGYPQQYPPQGGYPQQQPGGYGGYNNNQRYPQQNSASSGIIDSISNALKKYGLFYVILVFNYQRIWEV